MLARRSGGSNIELGFLRRRASASWVDLTFLRRRAGSSWIDIWPNYVPLSVVATPVVVFQPVGYVGPVGGESVATVSGGQGGESYTWTFRSGIQLQMTAAGNRAYFSYTFRTQTGSVSAVYRVTVNDGRSTAFADINVQLSLGTIA